MILAYDGMFKKIIILSPKLLLVCVLDWLYWGEAGSVVNVIGWKLWVRSRMNRITSRVFPMSWFKRIVLPITNTYTQRTMKYSIKNVSKKPNNELMKAVLQTLLSSMIQTTFNQTNFNKYLGVWYFLMIPTKQQLHNETESIQSQSKNQIQIKSRVEYLTNQQPVLLLKVLN